MNWRKLKKKIQLNLLVLKGTKQSWEIGKNHRGVPYEGPHVALTVLKNSKKLNEHYQCGSGLGITGRNLHCVRD